MDTTPAGTVEYTDARLNAFLLRILTTLNRTVRHHLDLKVHHNATHSQAEVFDLLTYCGFQQE